MFEENDPSGKSLSIKRLLDAPKNLVWEVWTKPEHIKKWWGAEGINTIIKEYNFSLGGKWIYHMFDDEGSQYRASGQFIEIHSNEKIITTDSFQADQRNLPQNMIQTISFKDILQNQTQITLIIEHSSAESCQQYKELGAIYGWNSSFDKLGKYLKTMVW